MAHSVEQAESLLKRLERPGWTWSPSRGGLWNEERQLLVTGERIREELEAALTKGFVEAVISGDEAESAFRRAEEVEAKEAARKEERDRPLFDPLPALDRRD